jgi:hypothetical protein
VLCSRISSNPIRINIKAIIINIRSFRSSKTWRIRFRLHLKTRKPTPPYTFPKNPTQPKNKRKTEIILEPSKLYSFNKHINNTYTLYNYYLCIYSHIAHNSALIFNYISHVTVKQFYNMLYLCST